MSWYALPAPCGNTLSTDIVGRRGQMKVAKCFYSFGDESEPGVTEQEARPVYGVTAAEVIATTEGRLYDKIKLARQVTLCVWPSKQRFMLLTTLRWCWWL
jgi:hypothetical protein